MLSCPTLRWPHPLKTPVVVIFLPPPAPPRTGEVQTRGFFLILVPLLKKANKKIASPLDVILTPPLEVQHTTPWGSEPPQYTKMGTPRSLEPCQCNFLSPAGRGPHQTRRTFIAIWAPGCSERASSLGGRFWTPVPAGPGKFPLSPGPHSKTPAGVAKKGGVIPVFPPHALSSRFCPGSQPAKKFSGPGSQPAEKFSV